MLLFVVQGQRAASYAFALVSVLVNLAYYGDRVQLISAQVARACLISIALPVAIALYSHAVADAHDNAINWRAWLARARNLLQRTHVHEDAETVQEDCTTDDDCNDEPDNKSLAQSLATEGLTRAQIGERLGVHPSTVGRWLNGKA